MEIPPLILQGNLQMVDASLLCQIAGEYFYNNMQLNPGFLNISQDSATTAIKWYQVHVSCLVVVMLLFITSNIMGTSVFQILNIS